MIEILIQQKSEIMVLIYKEWGQTGNHPHAVTLVMIVAGTQENEAPLKLSRKNLMLSSHWTVNFIGTNIFKH